MAHPTLPLYEQPHPCMTHPTPAWPTPPHTIPPLYDLLRPTPLVGFWKFTNGYEGLCMSGIKFPKPWQVKDKIIEWFLLQFIFYILQMTQTQEIITCRVSWMDMGVCVWVGESFLRNDKWQIKLLSWFFSNLHSTIYEWLKLKK